MSKTYKVGYGRPPKASRFSKGQSGNPKGRPKKVPSDEVALLDRVLMKPASRSDANDRESLSLSRLVVRQLVREAAEGNLEAVLFVVKHWRPQENASNLVQITLRGGLPRRNGIPTKV
jgi:hypothetical protein